MILTKGNYFGTDADMAYMSVSQYKQFEKCEAKAMQLIEGKWEQQKSTALLVGSYVDAHFEGSLDMFRAQNPEIFTAKGELKSNFKQAEEIINRIERDNMFMEYLSGEKQVIMTGEIFGVPFKVKVDSLLPDKIVDLKIMRDFEPVYVEGKGRVSFIEAWGYDIQGAVYQEIVRQNTGKKLPFYIAAATKETDGADIGIFELEQGELDICLELMEEDIKRFVLIKNGIIEPERCEKCDYCKHTKVLKAPVMSSELNGGIE